MTPDRTDSACENFAQDLSLSTFGELPDEQRPALETHLAACAGCRAERDLLARSLDLLRSDCAAAPPILKLSDARRGELLAQARSAAGNDHGRLAVAPDGETRTRTP
jgi:anti-sigma factor RsiW